MKSRKSSILNYKDRLRQQYAPLAKKYGNSFRAVSWGSEVGQNIRFKFLLYCIDYRNLRILDVGCGVVHLSAYLKKNNFKGCYLGIDLVPEMVKKAKIYNSDFTFKKVNSTKEAAFFKPDLVVASGLFTFSDNFCFKKIIAELFDLTQQALAFNSLSSWKANQLRSEFHADPIDALIYCGGLTKKVVLRHDYMPHDFSMYLYKHLT